MQNTSKKRRGYHSLWKVQVIIGDSHARNCADLLQDNLSTDFKVTSFVKPGASMNEIVNTARNEIKTLQSDDLIVV